MRSRAFLIDCRVGGVFEEDKCHFIPKLIDVQAENKTLKIQEQDDRLKIQHLLALTQPISEQVTFFRDCRPGTRTTYPSRQTPTPTTYPYPSTMHIGSEDMKQQRRKKKQDKSGFVVRGDASTLKNISQSIPANKVLRTIYMPNEQTAALAKTIENLQKQLESHQTLSETRIQIFYPKWLYIYQALLDGFAQEKAKMMLHHQHIEEKSIQLEKQVEKTKRILTQTTKDYLVLRHKSQEAERLAHEEIFQVNRKCETLTTEKTQLTEKVREETHALREIVREEGNQTVLEFRNQALSRERDLHMLKEQYAAMQEACTKRIQDLQVRLTKLRSRYRSLDRRRAMEMEGFTRDLAGLKRHLQKLEVILYGRGLSAQERQVLRYDENYALDSNELSEEIAALQRRLMDLSTDLAEA
ncbi:Coiled-coil domain-containing protein 77 [Phytophthora citrophthora]|uniref:Coiled-coil domain-containing protein 77 n=1 Tax=Phytophthora citrophthora TaxID=4793 RepID=A0AAD9LIS2_9STRA|nr:Coiled-coil domain-containing protein 77 [Phytophthora citrophthora]